MNKLLYMLFYKPKFSALRQEEYRQADNFMLKLIFAHWILVTVSGILFFNDYYLGSVSGGILFIATYIAYRKYRGTQTYRNLVAIVLLTFSVIAIQQSQGRLEMHFHVFVALSFLIIYRDMKNISFAALFTIIHHLIFNYLQQYNVSFFGTPIIIFNYGCGLDIVLLHAFFVLFEWLVLSKMVITMEDHFMELVRTREALQSVNTNLENMVKIRTDELESARIEAEQANALKSEFLANMSHEIRTPMNAIIGFTDLLEESVTTPKERNYVESVKSSSKVLLTIINDILDLSKVEAGKMHIELEPTDIHGIAKELESIFSLKARSKALELSVSIDPSIHQTLMLDEVRLRQILFNLISNAIKFTHEGYIRLFFKAVTFNEHLNLVITVEDSGIGIPKEEQDKIFSAFIQQKNQMTKEYGGTGLGLTIVKKLLDLMKGDIAVKSAPGQGSTFTITLRDVAISETKRIAHSQEMNKKIDFEPATVLIADDVELNRVLITEYLKETPMTLLQAANGQEALEYLENEAVDIVLMDIKMPVMDGYEATRVIKEQYRLPVIAITASVVAAESDPANKIFDDFLEKPLSAAKLKNTLSNYLDCTISTLEGTADAISEADTQESIDLRRFAQECPQLIDALNQAKEDGDIERISTFAQLLEACHQQHSNPAFHTLSQQLVQAVESFDIESCLLLLDKFQS